MGVTLASRSLRIAHEELSRVIRRNQLISAPLSIILIKLVVALLNGLLLRPLLHLIGWSLALRTLEGFNDSRFRRLLILLGE